MNGLKQKPFLNTVARCGGCDEGLPLLLLQQCTGAGACAGDASGDACGDASGGASGHPSGGASGGAAVRVGCP